MVDDLPSEDGDMGKAYKSLDMLTQVNSEGKNILHFATINKDKELIAKIVFWDSDSNQVRSQKDAKKKTA
jgi:hypothetical protein